MYQYGDTVQNNLTTSIKPIHSMCTEWNEIPTKLKSRCFEHQPPISPRGARRKSVCTHYARISMNISRRLYTVYSLYKLHGAMQVLHGFLFSPFNNSAIIRCDMLVSLAFLISFFFLQICWCKSFTNIQILWIDFRLNAFNSSSNYLYLLFFLFLPLSVHS